MPLYTRNGDAGLTTLAGGTPVAKEDLRVEAYGALDEATCFLGQALTLCSRDSELGRLLLFSEQRLYTIAALFAQANDARLLVTAEDIAILERAIDEMSVRTPPLSSFVLPGGTPLAASLHVARTVVRRAERRCLAALSQESRATIALPLAFLNRLSDFLFAAARLANAQSSGAEIPFDPAAKP